MSQVNESDHSDRSQLTVAVDRLELLVDAFTRGVFEYGWTDEVDFSSLKPNRRRGKCTPISGGCFGPDERC